MNQYTIQPNKFLLPTNPRRAMMKAEDEKGTSVGEAGGSERERATTGASLNSDTTAIDKIRSDFTRVAHA